MALPVRGIRSVDRRNDEVAACHSDTSSDEDGLPTKSIDIEHCWDGGQKHCNTRDTSRKERARVIGQAESCENEWGVVEHGVDPVPLLKDHGEDRHDCTLEERLVGNQGGIIVQTHLSKRMVERLANV
jgi:hypothetical protein